MSNEVDGPGAYVNEVRRNTQRYVEDLMAENEKLRRQRQSHCNEQHRVPKTRSRSFA